MELAQTQTEAEKTEINAHAQAVFTCIIYVDVVVNVLALTPVSALAFVCLV